MDPTRSPRHGGGRVWLAFALGAAILFGVGLIAAADIGRGRAIEATRLRAEDATTLAIAVLRGELEKQRALPAILARDPDVSAALTGGDRHALDLKFGAIAAETRTAVIYLLDAAGLTIAASNWDEPTSFVGNDYAFRDYYLTALQKGSAEQFALGTVSKRPGLYITARVADGDGKALGVIVVKAEFERVEADWGALGGTIYVADGRGVVLLSTEPDWRFRVERPLDEATQAEIRRSLQFGGAPLVPLPLGFDGELVHRSGAGRGANVRTQRAVATTGWTLDMLLPVGEAVRSEQSRLQSFVALALIVGLSGAALLLRRRQQADLRLQRAAEAKAELENRVAERTAALAGSNARLKAEIGERARAQERLADMREELAKANRLATLGQVTAGVAHEINQPLAALRTYAENARTFVGRREREQAESALGKVIGLTERIGHITDTLRGFARRGGRALEPVSLEEAIAGALMILDSALRQAAITPRIDAVSPRLQVMARHVELEQVLVNLLRNAVEAIETLPQRPGAPLVAIGVVEEPDRVIVTVADRGPGLDEAAVAALFTPFRSSKPRGLGLGLIICQDLVASFGGTLTAAGRPGEGCSFTITLRRAP
ncbi:sensor histidine kinase [Bosea sp. (in: a-proteobacteria)]|uniref:sensor histidine kinase n=1 Tax=Bosea sp. (in: a-proteobacteria) TaxID=1871050 RepID=UPI003B3AC93B